MKTSRFILILFAMFGSLLAWAEGETLMQFETQLEDRIAKLVRISDPAASVVVKGELKNDRASLPGLSAENVDVYSAGHLRNVKVEDIRKIEITIYSTQKQLPTWINDKIRNITQFRGVETKISTVELNESEINPQGGALIKAVGEWQQKVGEALQKTTLTLGIGAFFMCALIAGIGFYFARAMRSGLREHAERQITAAAADIPRAQMNNDKETDLSTEKTPDAQENVVLSDEAAEALIADCYWSQLDGYASWLWSQLPAAQKQKIIADLPFGFAYARILYAQLPEPGTYHRHPAYAKPLSLNLVSNEDLKNIVNKNHGLWKWLSPIRQQQLNVSLQERLKFENADAPKPERISGSPSSLRELAAPWGSFELTLSDEEYLLEHPDSVNMDQRAHLLTWIWLYRCEPSFQEQALTRYSAEDLASCWVGPEEVMNSLLARMPERKQKMVLEYKEQLKPSRANWVLKQISTEIAQLNKQQESYHASQAA